MCYGLNILFAYTHYEKGCILESEKKPKVKIDGCLVLAFLMYVL